MVLHYHFFNRSSRGFLHKILDFLRFCKKLNFLLHQPTYILRSQYCTSIKAPNKKLWLRILVRQPCLHGQAVKTSPSHGENWGSSPHGGAELSSNGLRVFCFWEMRFNIKHGGSFSPAMRIQRYYSMIALDSSKNRQVKVKVVPFPSSLSTEMLSPITSIISLAMDRPRPEPMPECALSTL